MQKKKPIKPIAKKPALKAPAKVPKSAAFAGLTPKKRKVVEGVIVGKKTKQIAAEIGVKERQARKLKSSPEVQDRLARFYADNDKELRELEKLSVKTVKEIMSKKSEDAKARLSAVQRSQEWQKMGIPKKDINVFSGITLEELEELLKEAGEI